MAKSYYLKFGSGDPRSFTGLSPTFLIFESQGVTLTPPAIVETLTGSGVYRFSWGTTTSISFLADAATTSPGTALRYISGSLDPADRADEYGNSLMAYGASITARGISLIALGTSNIALGTSGVALGTSILAQGTSIYQFVFLQFNALSLQLGDAQAAIGSTTSLLGDNSTMPVDLFGYLMRVSSLLEGQSRFVKGTGILTNYDWTGATTISQRTITNSISLVTKV